MSLLWKTTPRSAVRWGTKNIRYGHARHLSMSFRPCSSLPCLTSGFAGRSPLIRNATRTAMAFRFPTAPQRSLATEPTPVNDCPQSRVREYSLANPDKFWLAASKDIDWITPPTVGGQWDNPSESYRWFSDGVLNMSYNCLDRHVLAGRGDTVAVIHDSPVTGNKVTKYTYRELMEKVVDFTMVLRRHNVRKGDTVVIYMPLVVEALVAILACTRVGAIHSVVFGGFAAAELAKRVIDSQPRVILSASCGIERPGKHVAYKPLLDEALAISKKAGVVPEANIIFQRPEQSPAPLIPSQGDLDWSKEVELAREQKVDCDFESGMRCEPMRSTDPLYILYTSGTTGTPKGVVRDVGGHAVALQWAIRNFLNLSPGEVFFSSSDLGWAVGHSFICYAPLLGGCTSVLYEGKPVGTPDAGAFWRVLSEHKVKTFFTAPTALMILRREDPTGEFIKKYNLEHLRTVFLAGERCPPEIIHHFEKLLPARVPLIDHWWQTESGGPITGIAMGPCDIPGSQNAIKHSGPVQPPPSPCLGSAGIPVPGYDVRIARVREEEEDGTAAGKGESVAKGISPLCPKANETYQLEEAMPGEQGQVLIKLPLPPGMFPTLWRNHEKYIKSYFSRFPGYYDTGDVGLIDKNGYIHIMSRADDIINVAAHRLSTGVFEESLVSHPNVAEACVVPCPHKIKGSLPLAFLVLPHFSAGDQKMEISTESCITLNNSPPANISKLHDEVIQAVRTNVGAFASMQKSHLMIVTRLPKTRSGKVLRKLLRTMVRYAIENQHEDLSGSCPLPMPATIEDSAVVDEVWPIVVNFARNHAQASS
ncbi:hypothetical protein IWQ62_001047 [Dispira parvispora]|uniref:Uncharacterized protein n=1 Tax=Dispira parvispora TaxID=1520584 RepID=A0A9W8AX08_9FUNG|nr:hypothetical protein IWQ62_001047 [Dispira parvispora]